MELTEIIEKLEEAVETENWDYYKRLTNLNSDKSLQGLVIDWHLANSEMGFDNMIVEPVSDYQPTYAYA